LREEILRGLAEVLDTCGFAQGPATQVFEKEFATACQAPECVTLNSGTSALHLALRALDIKRGDEVITVSATFIATAWPMLYEGVKPVFVDIDPKRYTLNPALLEAAITPRTRAIIPVHLYGQCADMDPILAIASQHGIPVIEDAAQAAGAEYKGRRAGSMGELGCFSFYPGKNLGACGEGGAITTRDAKIAARVRMLRDHAQEKRYVHGDVGYNYRMDSFQAVPLSVKLRHLDRWNAGRAAAAARYDRLLAGLPVVPPAPCRDGRHIHHLYVIRHPRRDDLLSFLMDRGIATGLHYPTPVHLQKPFAGFGYGKGDLPVTTELAATCLSLPMFPEITEEQQQRVADAIRAFG
jgi:dTDP-4-amino-4,6-dideoxygalactose transaminase